MRKIDTLFLFCVLGFAGLFAVRTVALSVPLFWGGNGSDSAALGVAGQSRNIDTAKLKHLLESRELSDHEAEFYGPVGTTVQPENGEIEEGEAEVGIRREGT